MNRPSLWIALTRPDNFVNALAVAEVGRERFSRCHLLYENSPWWKNADWEDFRGAFDEVHAVEKVRTCRGLLDVPRFSRGLRARQRKLTDLRIAPEDTIVTLAGITVLSNALASVYPKVRKVLCTTVRKYLDASRPYSFWQYRPTTSGWLQNNVLEPWTGLRRTVLLKPWRGGGDGVRLERLKEPLGDVFEEILLLSNDGDEIPSGAGHNVHPAPFPSLNTLAAAAPASTGGQSAARKIVFFGTPFLLVRNLRPEVYAEHLDACLDFLRRSYPPDSQFIYRPHPAETGEKEKLRLDGFTFEEDRQVAELYFLRQRQCIEAVYSVSSTVSRVALNYGLNGYALWRCFPFDGPAATYFENLMGTVPAGFDVRSLEHPPVAYASRLAPNQGAPPTFQDALCSVFKAGLGEKPFAASPESPV